MWGVNMCGEEARSEIGVSWVEGNCGGFVLWCPQFNSSIALVLSSYWDSQQLFWLSLFVLILSLPLTRKALDEVFDYGQR